MNRHAHRAGSDVDDAAEAARDHPIQRCFDQFDGRQHVGVDRGDPVLTQPVAEIPRWRTARVVYQNIGLGAGSERGLTARLRRYVRDDRSYRDRTRVADLFCRLFESLDAPRHDGDISALARQSQRAGTAQAFTGGAYQRRSTFDTQIHVKSALAVVISKPERNSRGIVPRRPVPRIVVRVAWIKWSACPIALWRNRFDVRRGH